MSSLSGVGTLFVGGIIFTVWIISQIWYIILPIVVIIVGLYLYDQHCKEKIKQQKIIEQREAQLKRIIQAREEKKRLEEERIRKEQERKEQEQIRKEQEKIRIKKEKELRVKTRLEQFKITEKEAQLIFGKTWINRFEKPDEKFIVEIIRVSEKIMESDLYKQKIVRIMEKVFDIIDLCMHQIWGKMQGWDDIDYENWEEDWQDVRYTWRKERHYYQDHEEEYSSDNTETNDFQKYYEILGLKVGATIKEIKTQFRKLMIIFHPDRNKSPDAEIKCREIIEAYNKLAKMVNN